MSDHKRPIPWPVRPVILLMMGLPPTATREEYFEQWEKTVVPLLSKSLVDLLTDRVREIQRTEDKSFMDAWTLVNMRFRPLARAMDEPAIRRRQSPRNPSSSASNISPKPNPEPSHESHTTGIGPSSRLQ